jgi:hypothetical protein
VKKRRIMIGMKDRTLSFKLEISQDTLPAIILIRFSKLWSPNRLKTFCYSKKNCTIFINEHIPSICQKSSLKQQKQ